MVNMVTVQCSGTIQVSPGDSSRSLYQYQAQAIQALDRKNATPFEGLLVLPTGGGKTLTAVRWLLRNFIGRHKKVLWIAHRHELLNQAFFTIKDNAYLNLAGNRERFRYRIISGSPEHDRPVNIQADDDIIIASKDSLNRGINYLIDRWLGHTDELLLVVDEAHHATARTYRNLIQALKQNLSSGRTFKMLGLTATPFRTAEDERGLLRGIFPDDIIFKEDLRTLIARGILAEPVFEEVATRLDVSRRLTDQQIRAVQASDKLPENIAEEIAQNSERNHLIVDHYVNNRERYKQLLVFAINIKQAIALNGLFNDRQIKSKAVVSEIRDQATGSNISNRENKQSIQDFREGRIDVLVNVNILTEGVDLPNVQTVFLTRQTTSTILMTQMIGRALRGEAAGGTEKAYIVSFIDQWQNRINWVNPKELDPPVDWPDTPPSRETEKRIVQLISVKLMEEFARMMDRLVDTSELEPIEFLRRLPLGIYCFAILEPTEIPEDPASRNYEVLVYDDTEEMYDAFLNNLEYLFETETVDLGERESLSDQELDYLFGKVKREYFANHETLIGYRDEDIRNILRYYAQNETKPTFLAFRNRQECDLAKVAHHIIFSPLTRQEEANYVNSLWDDERTFWRVLFGYNKGYFINQLAIEIRKIQYPDLCGPKRVVPPATVIPDTVDIHSLPLFEIKTRDFEYYQKLRNSVYAKQTDSDGFITCATSGFKSRNRISFQIDHINPMSEGGLSTLDNLRILSRRAHAERTRRQNTRNFGDER